MKKRILFAFGLIFSGFVSFSQITVPDRENLDKFFKTTLMVVYDDNPMSDYNFKIKEAIEKYWKITPYKFIKPSELEKYRKDPKYSFLTVDRVFFEKDKTKAQYEFFSVSLGGNYRTFKDMPQIANIPLSYYGVDEETYAYKIPVLIKFLQNHILNVKKHPEINKINVKSFYTKQIPQIHNKTLYLAKEELTPGCDSEKEIKKLYPYPFKIVSRDELEQAIDEGKDIVFFHKVGPEGTKRKARCWKVVFDNLNANMYYFDYHMIDKKHPDGILPSDLKKLGKKK